MHEQRKAEHETQRSPSLSALTHHSRWCLLCPTVSEQGHKLAELGLVTTRRQGSTILYQLRASPILLPFLALLSTLEEKVAPRERSFQKAP